MTKVALTVLATTLCATVALADQQVFRSTVQTVPIYATVLDNAGRLVPDLKQEDFEVFDNNKPAAITSFAAEVQPIAVVVALDTSGSMTLVLDLAKNAAEAFVLRLLPADRARIVSFDDKMIWSPDFTSDRDKLLGHLRMGIQFGNGTRLWDALYEAVGVLKAEETRKVVLVLSDGEDFGSRLSGNDVFAKAQDDHVMVYTIGLRNRYFNGAQWVTSQPDRALKKMSAQTGGGWFELTRATELNSTFSKIADELHRQYLIAISPSTLDGKQHVLNVRVKTPGMTARARQSYIAASPK
jgi:Ca-activated chloride channel homolog